jgi:ATP-binding cassette subfamily B multidrug efflux pump
MSLRRLLRSHLGPYARLLSVVVLLQAIQTAATLALPALNAKIIDDGVLAGDDAVILTTGGVMIGFTIVQIVFAVAATWYGARAAMSFGRDVRRDLFGRVLEYSAEEVGLFGAPSLITRITNDVQQVQIMVVTACTMMVAAPLTLVIGVIMALREDVGLSVVLLVSVPAAVLILGNVVRKMVPAFQAMQERIDVVNRVLREQITGIRVVRAFVREPEESVRFSAANDDLTEASLRTGRLMAAMFPAVTFIINGSSIAVIWVGADRISAGELGLGSLIAYLTYLIQILMAVVMTTFTASMIPRASVAAERIQEVLDTRSSVRPADHAVTETPAHGVLELRDVEFRYPGAEQPVLQDISFRVEAGRTTAVIGSTGAGKSTLVDLVPRLFDATAGTVLVDGVDVRELDPDVLWSRVGYVPQKPYLFSGTVASNMRYGRPDATDDELWEALEIAQAADFVRAMPDGIDSPITQGGSNVSGGQRQRLCIARALVVRPEIFVFDDSFSALDLATDARLRAALEPHTADAATLIVAQRVSTITGADEIIVLEDGRIVGRGPHDELLRTCETYAEIVDSQLGQDVPA